MKFSVVTLFPDELNTLVGFGVLGRAIDKKTIAFEVINPRAYTEDTHHTVDDRPFGGGDGMVMKCAPLSQAVAAVKEQASATQKTLVIHLSPQGNLLTSELALRLATQFDHLILISSRYAGVDQRFIANEVDYEISIGDYVLSGGELPAAIVMDVVSRFIPGVLGKTVSAHEESFGKHGWLEAPQFTRPEIFNGHKAPEVLMSGHHENILQWREHLSIISTLDKRPDLFSAIHNDSLELAVKLWPSVKKLILETADREYQVFGLSLEKSELVLRGDALFSQRNL